MREFREFEANNKNGCRMAAVYILLSEMHMSEDGELLSVAHH